MGEILVYLSLSCTIIFFILLVILGVDKWVLLYKRNFGSFRHGPIPPRTMLNDFGKLVLTALYAIGVLALIFVFMGVLFVVS